MPHTTLYVHIPWCIRKCPYCDFNSHKAGSNIPESEYITKLLTDLTADIDRFGKRELSAIFIGGGTPSLLSASAIDRLLEGIASRLPFHPHIEITMEANPGTVEQNRFQAYRQAGINRLSLGIQSFDYQQLKQLGRIHSDKEAETAILTARNAGFDNLNLDLMHGLPNQSIEEGLTDLRQALSFQPEHLSWYQLTIEPNTLFYKQPPKLPNHDACAELEEIGFQILAEHGYQRYEISAFAQPNKPSQHNMNYWLFGDYFGIGAGAHGKLTNQQGEVFRSQKKRQPKDYLASDEMALAQVTQLNEADRLFEYMLNTTRLQQPVALSLFKQQTGLELQLLTNRLTLAENKGFIHVSEQHWQVTELGRRFTNDLQALFLP